VSESRWSGLSCVAKKQAHLITNGKGFKLLTSYQNNILGYQIVVPLSTKPRGQERMPIRSSKQIRKEEKMPLSKSEAKRNEES
jgi:hypothetical protein